MLKLTTKDGATIMSFQGYKEVYQLITLLEDLQCLRGASSDYWGFTVFSPEQVGRLMITLAKYYDKKVIFDSLDKNFPMLDICEGDPSKARQLLLDGSVSLEALREDWCIDYWAAHGMDLSPEEG